MEVSSELFLASSLVTTTHMEVKAINLSEEIQMYGLLVINSNFRNKDQLLMQPVWVVLRVTGLTCRIPPGGSIDTITSSLPRMLPNNIIYYIIVNIT